jgi:hypothetical protein
MILGGERNNSICLVVLLALLCAGNAQTLSPGSQANLPLKELVRRTVNNELKASNDGAEYMFKDLKQTPSGSQTKLLVETRDATAGILVAINGKPLSAQQREDEIARIERFANSPEELHRKQKQEKEDAEHTTRIMKALPDAFIYEKDGTEPGQEGIGRPGDELVKLKFRPDPKYSPPTHTEQVLTGMTGYILIDANHCRIAKIDGTLMKEVGFGWGILGHLDKGGRFVVQQVDVGDDHWEISRMDLALTGKILLFKNLNIKSTEIYSDFRPAPRNLTFAQGVELLKKQEAEIAENHPQK